jgi:glycosyltransferase involved in cell wall biosynthesis
MKRPKPIISVVIVVKNDRGIARTLELIQESETKRPFEIIVVDASAPAALADIRDHFPSVNWVMFDQQGKYITIAEQRNRSLELAQGEIIVSIDANCEPHAGWLSQIEATLDSGESIVCGPVEDSNPANLVHYAPIHSEKKYVSECTTVSAGMKCQVFDVVGKFDTTLEYGEDIDFFWRAIDAGFRLCFDPKVVISHNWGGSSEQVHRAFRYGKWRAKLYKKHWRLRWQRLVRVEPHVWIYPLLIVSVIIGAFWPPYIIILLLLLVILAVKNRSISLVIHHLIFGLGVIAGLVGAQPRASAKHSGGAA